MLNSGARQALRILGWQWLGVVLLTACGSWIYSWHVGRSVLVGSGIGWIATAYVVFVLVKHSLRPTKPATLLTLYGNWFVKTALVVGLLLVALRCKALMPLAVLIGLFGSLVAYWLAAMLGASRDLKIGMR